MAKAISIENHAADTAKQIEEITFGDSSSWVKGWNSAAAGGALRTTGDPYTRGNQAHLSLLGMVRGYDSRTWMTSKQGTQAGTPFASWDDAKGQHATVWAPIVRKNAETGTDRFCGYRAYRVYNGDLFAGHADPVREEKADVPAPDEAAAAIVALGGGCIHGGSRAYYRPSSDTVHVPDRQDFASLPEYVATVAHERIHWTGHRSRLDRVGITNPAIFGDHRYAQEEIVAESGAAFLMASLGMLEETLTNHGAYLRSWLKKAGNTPQDLMQGMGQGIKAAEYALKAAGLA